ncbi:MAG: hypothetical protein IKU61_05765 [Clostridia bacterium]|nr:hypothetical protein [Clostridia bacterium]
MYYWNENEEIIIGTFINKADEFYGKDLLLNWSDENSIVAIFDSIIEDEEDCDMNDEEYEEFWSFVFKAVEVKGKPPVSITEDEYFIVNYHNFPDEIIVDGKKIN